MMDPSRQGRTVTLSEPSGPGGKGPSSDPDESSRMTPQVLEVRRREVEMWPVSGIALVVASLVLNVAL